MKYSEKFARRIQLENGEVRYQKLLEHIEGVSAFTEEFVQKFFIKNAGRILGYLHDLGKYSDEFQDRIRGENIKVDHSTAGAVVCDDLENEFKNSDSYKSIIYKIFKYAIVSHHSGLINHGNRMNCEGTLTHRISKRYNELCDFSDWEKEIKINDIKDLVLTSDEYKFFTENFSIQMLIRFLFSALVDGDRLDAQRFSEGENSIVNTKSELNLTDMLNVFNKFMESKREKSNENKINMVRNRIFNECVNKSSGDRGIYSLCVPTGGGKTLSSLAFALNHAKLHGHDRIVYSLPFTSIIEQNAKVYADIFGEENVLEHHCNFNFSNTYNENEYSEKQIKYKLLTENWDSPLIVTTNVQLFESMYSNKPSSVRKLHNIYNSIIVLDEAQVIPNKYLKPCMMALQELVKNYNCTVLICTATQPEFQKNGLISENFKITEIIENTYQLFEDLKRVNAELIGVQSVENICEKINSYKQVLVIVNTKNHAKDIFENLNESDGNFHLSTNMYPNHRKQIIKDIRERLKNGEECRVVSTQLIEAGVDVDFPVVFRSVSGIDSIVQASGRCNREGKLENATIYIFKPKDKSYLGIDYLKLTSQIGEYVMKSYQDILSIDAISRYFEELFRNTKYRQDEHGILNMINKHDLSKINYDFENISKEFKFIDNVGIQVIILTEESKQLINRLKYSETGIKGILRKLNGFSINIPEYVFKELIKNNFVDEIVEGLFILNNFDMYDSKLGFDKDNLGKYDYVI